MSTKPFANGRSEDQLRRNHAVQYQSLPDFPWNKLRETEPGKYESYADVEPSRWHKIRAEIAGSRARFYIDDAAQPCLIVNDLKLPERAGSVGLWPGQGTRAYFRDLRVTIAVL